MSDVINRPYHICNSCHWDKYSQPATMYHVELLSHLYLFVFINTRLACLGLNSTILSAIILVITIHLETVVTINENMPTPLILGDW